MKPAGDQPEAIAKILELLQGRKECVMLHGATGTGKTLVLANVIAKLQKSALILCHNKSLAEQLHAELARFFPEANVLLYISVFEQYRPATVLANGDYIPAQKGHINEQASDSRKLALAALNERPTIVVATTAAIFPGRSSLEAGEHIGGGGRTSFALPKREREKLAKGIERELAIQIKSEEEEAAMYRGWAQGMAKLVNSNPATAARFRKMKGTPDELRKMADEAEERVVRLREMVQKDLENIRDFGCCSELYDKYGSLLPPEARGTLMDRFVKEWGNDWLLVFDESHASLKSFSRASEASKSHLNKLAEAGYRLRVVAETGGPLSLEEMWKRKPENTHFISATPGARETEMCSSDAVVEMVQRPTHILDPEVEVKDQGNDMKGIMSEVRRVCDGGGQVILATTTQKDAEAMAAALQLQDISAGFVHCKLTSSERAKVINDFRTGGLHVLVGIGLIKEGLDFPGVELVVILDSDKGGLHRDQECLEQLAGRAARNVNGRVLLCMTGKTKTEAMENAIQAITARRDKQRAKNEETGNKPTSLVTEELANNLRSPRRPSLSAKPARKEKFEREWNAGPVMVDIFRDALLDEKLTEFLIDWVALVGGEVAKTQCDKFPGCHVVGPKLAWELILEYKSLEKVIEAARDGTIDEVFSMGPTRQKALGAFGEQALRNKEFLLCWKKRGLLPGFQSSGGGARSYYTIARAFIPSVD